MNKPAPGTHTHAEAFCHMTYIGIADTKYIKVSIWNSRDGVTPFITVCKEYGVQLQHVNFRDDRYDPNYKPKKGDLIWRTWTDDEIRQAAEEKWIEMMVRLERFSDMPLEERKLQDDSYLSYCRKFNGKGGREKFVKMMIENFDSKGQPFLELVEEDWK